MTEPAPELVDRIERALARSFRFCAVDGPGGWTILRDVELALPSIEGEHELVAVLAGWSTDEFADPGWGAIRVAPRWLLVGPAADTAPLHAAGVSELWRLEGDAIVHLVRGDREYEERGRAKAHGTVGLPPFGDLSLE